MSRIDSKRKEMQVAIRRQQIKERFGELRKMNDNDFCTPDLIAQQLQLQPKIQHYSMLELLREKEEAWITPPLGTMQNQSTKTIPIEIHCKFWKLYSEQMSKNEATYDQLIGEALMKLISHCNYSEIHQNTTYELHLLNMLQMAAPSFPTPFRKALLDWISGPEGLRVIEASLDGNFLRPALYGQVYRVIEAGLKSELKGESEDAADVLMKLLVHSDWDDTFEIYQKNHGLMVYLCAKIQRYCIEESTVKYNKAALYLLETYDEAVVDYARAGLAYVAALLVTSPIRENYTDGLQILRMITQIDDRKNVIFLLKSEEIEGTGIWRRLCKDTILVNNESREVREHYQAVIRNILVVGYEEEVIDFCRYFSDRYEDIVQMFHQQLDRNQEDIPIMLLILQSLLSLSYNSRSHGPSFLELCQGRKIIPQLMKLMETKEGPVEEAARKIMDALGVMQHQ